MILVYLKEICVPYVYLTCWIYRNEWSVCSKITPQIWENYQIIAINAHIWVIGENGKLEPEIAEQVVARSSRAAGAYIWLYKP